MLLPIGTAMLVLLGWTVLSLQLPPVLLPSPLEVLTDAWQERTTLLEATLWTAIAALSGLGIAGITGLIGAALFQWSRWLEVAIYPYALLLQTVPIVAVAPLLVVWLGYGTPVAVVSAAIVSFFPILTSANLGLRSTPQPQLELLRLYGASWRQELLLLRIPHSLPYLFSGMRTAVGLSVIGAIVGEFVGSNGIPRSLGFIVLRSARSAETGQSFAAIFCATLLALLLFGAIRLLEHQLIGRWHGRGSQ